MSNSAKYNWEKTKCANTADFFTGYEYTSTDTAVSDYTQVPYNVDNFYSTITNPGGILRLKPGVRIQGHSTAGVRNITWSKDPWTWNNGGALMSTSVGHDKAMYLTENSINWDTSLNKGLIIWNYEFNV